MTIGRCVLGLGAASASCTAFFLAACSSSSGGTANLPTGDATVLQEGAASNEDAGSPADGASNSPPDGSQESGTEAGSSLDGGAEASDGALADAVSDGAACIPVDAGTADAAAVAAGNALANMTQSFIPRAPHDCVSCHGTTFAGGLSIEGAISKNLTPDPATGLGCWTDEQIVTAILQATTPQGEMLCIMPQWSTLGMTADQAEEIVDYLRSLPPVVNAVAPTVCPGSGDAGTGDAQPADGSNGD
jgi:hypothetical protein